MEFPDTREGFKNFVQHYADTHEGPIVNDSNIPFKYYYDFIREEEIKGELIDWTIYYLKLLCCPDGLKYYMASQIYKGVLRDGTDKYIDKNTWHDKPKEYDCQWYEYQVLMKAVLKEIHEVLVKYNKNGIPENINPIPAEIPEYSAHAIRNTRRRMEDRHVVVPDLSALLELQNQPITQFYAVYDGHGGVETAEFAAKQFHLALVEQEEYPSDICTAMKKCVKVIDERFEDYSKRENMRCGTTAVITIIRDNTMYVCWIGDSQIEILRKGSPITVMKAHKPNDSEEKKRIEDLGGCVVWFGAWRVNGQLAVSRAIGDVECKPFVSSDAETSETKLQDDDDLICLACDGFWDVYTPKQLTGLVNEHLTTNKASKKSLAEFLCTKAKEAGSSDNISIVVIFLKKDFSEAMPVEPDEPEVVENKDDTTEDKEQKSEEQNNDESGSSSVDEPTCDSTDDEKMTVEQTQSTESCVIGSKLKPELREKPPHKLLRNYGKVPKPKKNRFIVTESTPHARMPNTVVSYKLYKNFLTRQQMAPQRKRAAESLISLTAVEHDDASTAVSDVISDIENMYSLPPILDRKRGNSLSVIVNGALNRDRYLNSQHNLQKKGWLPYSASIVMTNKPHNETPSEVELRYWSKNSDMDQRFNKRGRNVTWNSCKVPSKTKTVINNSFYSTLKPKSVTSKKTVLSVKGQATKNHI